MCNCIEDVEKKLLESGKNTALDVPITFTFDGQLASNRLSVPTRKRDDKKREKPMRIFANYCPFCGKPYEEAPRRDPLQD